MPTYETVTIARDESANIGHTLQSLRSQTVKPAKMIVVDDGSLDGTAEAADRFGCELVRLPRHQGSYLGRPMLALVINAGLEKVSEHADYVVIVDADNPLPAGYMERLMLKMEQDPLTVAASGVLTGEAVDLEMPRNSGFMVKVPAWRRLNGMRYPYMYGYEGWLRFRFIQQGFRVKVFPDVASATRRMSRLKGMSDGRAMYALGYDPLYAVGRTAVNFPSQPFDSLRMLVGYFARGDAERSEIAPWVRSRQRARMWEKVRARLTGSAARPREAPPSAPR